MKKNKIKAEMKITRRLIESMSCLMNRQLNEKEKIKEFLERVKTYKIAS